VATWRTYRRHAIVVIFVIAAIVTPTPDPFNQSLFALPLILLYELAIWVSAFVGRRKPKRKKLKGGPGIDNGEKAMMSAPGCWLVGQPAYLRESRTWNL